MAKRATNTVPAYRDKIITDLKSALRTLGGAEVMQLIAQIERESCTKDYADNHGAIIHQYTPIIERAAAECHGLRVGRVAAAIAGTAPKTQAEEVKGEISRMIGLLCDDPDLDWKGSLDALRDVETELGEQIDYVKEQMHPGEDDESLRSDDLEGDDDGK